MAPLSPLTYKISLIPVFTDGGATADIGYFGIYGKNFIACGKVPQNFIMKNELPRNSKTAELYAILFFINHVSEETLLKNSIVLTTDCKWTIFGLEFMKAKYEGKIPKKYDVKVEEFIFKNEVFLQKIFLLVWKGKFPHGILFASIPGHSGILGNTIADRLGTIARYGSVSKAQNHFRNKTRKIKKWATAFFEVKPVEFLNGRKIFRTWNSDAETKRLRKLLSFSRDCGEKVQLQLNMRFFYDHNCKSLCDCKCPFIGE